MRGRRPKPTWLKVIAGNPGQRPLNDQEPEPIGELKEPPPWFDKEQRAAWGYAIKHAPAGLLRFIDRSALTAWVCAEVEHAAATAKVRQFGAVIKAPKTGTPMQSPYMAIQNRQAELMIKAAAELGFTPSSRSRVKVEQRNAGGAFEDLKELD